MSSWSLASQLSFLSGLKVLMPVLALIGLLGLGGCEFFYVHYSDCRYYEGPRFENASLSRPILNQEYSDHVRVSFDDDWHIESYDYDFEFSGNLPPGLSYFQDQKSIYFEGAAIALGNYSFTIAVNARYAIRDRYYYYNNEYCSYRTAQNYLLIVDPF